MKSTLIALLVTLFSVGSLAIADEAATSSPSSAQTAPAKAKPVKKHKHYKKEVKATDEKKAETTTTAPANTEAAPVTK